MAEVFGNYSYDDSKVLAAPNAFDPALRPGNRLFKRPLHSANLVANAHFLRMNWNIAGFFRRAAHRQRFLGAWIHERSQLSATGIFPTAWTWATDFRNGGSFRESFRPALSGSDRVSSTRVQLPAGVEVCVGRRRNDSNQLQRGRGPRRFCDEETSRTAFTRELPPMPPANRNSADAIISPSYEPHGHGNTTHFAGSDGPLRSGDRSGSSRATGNGDESVLRVLDELRRSAEFEYMSRCAWDCRARCRY